MQRLALIRRHVVNGGLLDYARDRPLHGPREHLLIVSTYAEDEAAMYVHILFFSSRRRHTRCLSDWSSDVCSSDLNDQLVIHKGKGLPFGSDPYRPSDSLLADTYAPIPLERLEVGSLLERRFTDRDELGRALFEVLEKLARPKVYSEEAADLDRGLYFVRRAEKLKGLTEEQRASLKTMQSELSYYLARSKLDDARKALAEAMSQLQLAADSNNRHARSAHQMLMEVREPAK